MFTNKSGNLLFHSVKPSAISEEGPRFKIQRQIRYRSVDKQYEEIKAREPRYHLNLEFVSLNDSLSKAKILTQDCSSNDCGNTTKLPGSMTDRSEVIPDSRSLSKLKRKQTGDNRERVIKENGYEKLREQALDEIKDQVRQKTIEYKKKIGMIQKSTKQVDGVIKDMIGNTLATDLKHNKLLNFQDRLNQPELPIIRTNTESLLKSIEVKKHQIGSYRDMRKYANFYDQLRYDNVIDHGHLMKSRIAGEKIMPSHLVFPSEKFKEYSFKTGCRIPNFFKS